MIILYVQYIIPPPSAATAVENHAVYLFFLNQQSEYNVFYELMCWLSGSLTCRLPNVMWSPPARSLVSSINVDWFLAPRRWGFNLKSNYTNYPDHGHHGDPPSHKENPHGRAGNRTRDLVISSQKLWRLDHEAGQLQKWLYVLSILEQETRNTVEQVPCQWDELPIMSWGVILPEHYLHWPSLIDIYKRML